MPKEQTIENHFILLQLFNKEYELNKQPFLRPPSIIIIRNYIYLPAFIKKLEALIKSVKTNDPDSDIAISFIDSFIKKFKKYCFSDESNFKALGSHPGIIAILEAATQQKNLEIIKGLLIFLNIPFELLAEPLKFAARNHQHAMVSEILKYSNISPEVIRQVFNEVVRVYPIDLNAVRLSQILVHYRPDNQVWWDLSDYNFRTGIYRVINEAADAEDEVIINDLLKQTSIDINAPFGSPLAHAASQGHRKVVKRLLAHGVTARTLNNALDYATLHEQEEIVVEILLYAIIKNLADDVLNFKYTLGLSVTLTLLSYALYCLNGKYIVCNKNSQKHKNIIFKLLATDSIKKENLEEPFIIAAEYGNTEIFLKLLPKFQDNLELLTEALKLSALNFQSKIVQILIKTKKIPSNMVKAVFSDVLMNDKVPDLKELMEKWGFTEVICELLQSRPENETWWNDLSIPVDKADNLQEKIIVLFLQAAWTGNHFMVNDLILHACIDVNITRDLPSKESNALSLAAAYRHLEVVKVLIKTNKLSSKILMQSLSNTISINRYANWDEFGKTNIRAIIDELRAAHLLQDWLADCKSYLHAKLFLISLAHHYANWDTSQEQMCNFFLDYLIKLRSPLEKKTLLEKALSGTNAFSILMYNGMPERKNDIIDDDISYATQTLLSIAKFPLSLFATRRPNNACTQKIQTLLDVVNHEITSTRRPLITLPTNTANRSNVVNLNLNAPKTQGTLKSK